MTYQFFSAKKLLELIDEGHFTKISDIVIENETSLTGRSHEEIFENMKRRLYIMKESIMTGSSQMKRSRSGMIGGESKLIDNLDGKQIFMSDVMKLATKYALAVMETNSCMGKIVAAPTAGSAGIIPGCLWAIQEKWGIDEDTLCRGLLTASGMGIIIGHYATFSAAEAGCQAEIGVSTAMAAAAISEIRGLSPEWCVNAAALALKNLLGLACDPIGGFVEVPCVKRNAIGVVHAMTASDLSAAGIKSIVPFDEVVKAMNNIAMNMNENIRETSKGGLAISKTAQEIVEKIKVKYGKSERSITEPDPQ